MDQVAEESAFRTGRILETWVPDDLPVLAERDRVRHVLTNLADNAAQADRSGAPIAIRAQSIAPDDPRVAIVVSDHGPGIPDSLRKDLFQPFRTTRAGEGGSGLGLALARRFAEDCGGSLALARTGPDGTAFEFRLDRSDESGAGTEPDTGPAAAPGDRGGREILIVDDEVEIGEVVRRMLERDGWSVRTARSPAACLEALGSGSPDLILLDYNLSAEMTCEQLLREMASLDPGIRDRILVITGSLEGAIDSGSLPDVLFKPFSIQELRERIALKLGS